MFQLKAVVVTFALVGACAQAREARAQSRVFTLSGGFITQMREVRTAPSPVDSTQDRFFPGVHAGAGIELRPKLSLEASIAWFAANTFEWPFSYLFLCCSIKRTTERDLPLVVVLRYGGDCTGPWCASVFAGGGVNLHRIRLQSRPRCSPDPYACGRDFALESNRTDAEPLVTLGVQLTIKASARVQFGPSASVMLVMRPEYLSEYLHRGPTNVSSHAFTVGVNLIWSSRAR